MMPSYLLPEIIPTKKQRAAAKVLIVVGQTGSGKTTLLNALANYHMGVKYRNQFRYQIIQEDLNRSQAESQTSEVREYYLQAQQNRPALIIIDTPGFGDTKGIDHDENSTAMIKTVLQTKIDSLTAICFVAQSSNARLTAQQKYIFCEALKLFGKDLAENVVCMLTFCDSNQPQIISALKEKSSPFYPLKRVMEKPWYFKFNNSAIFKKNDHRDPFHKLYWDSSLANFSEFYRKKLAVLTPKKLTMTFGVWQMRDVIEVIRDSQKNLIDELHACQKKLTESKMLVEQFEEGIDKNKNFMIKFNKPQITKKSTVSGKFVTNCLDCSSTCHYPCLESKGLNMNLCRVIVNEKCTKCPGKCHFSRHANSDFYFEVRMIEEEKKSDEMFEAHDQFQDKLKSELYDYALLTDEQQMLEEKQIQIHSELATNIQKLQEKALILGFTERKAYLQELIAQEKQNRELGYEIRVAQLSEMIQRDEFLDEIPLLRDRQLMGNDQWSDTSSSEDEHTNMFGLRSTLNKGQELLKPADDIFELPRRRSCIQMCNCFHRCFRQ